MLFGASLVVYGWARYPNFTESIKRRNQHESFLR
ncbi:hypothetical protein B0G57_10445 [Trinickia symbiotica]|nr:hypothetical protein B0G57_10445 [Trinickia symbiotica]